MRLAIRHLLPSLTGLALGLSISSATTAADLTELKPAPPPDRSASRRARESFAGPDLRGKDGPTARIGLDLTQLYFEHQEHLARAPGLKFVPANPLVRIRDQDVVIDAVAAGDPTALRDALVALGMTRPAIYGRYVSGLLPVRALAEAAHLAELKLTRPAYSRVLTGSVTSQGDAALRADLARPAYGVDGTGVVVGSLSDSYDCLGGAAGDVASGDLPAGVVVLADEPGCSSGTDEGRAMMQIVRDVAPGAAQAFHTAYGGTADFANGIGQLAASAGAQVINDDVIYLAEPMFQDGVIAQAVDNVNAAGVAYFSAAGNQARQSYEAAFAPIVVSGTTRHNFGAGDTMQQVTIPAHTEAIVVLQWDQPFFSVSGSPGAASDLDIVLYSAQGSALAGGVDNNIGGDPVEVFGYTNPTGQARNYQLQITLASGPAPGRLKYAYFGGLTINEYATSSGTIYGHANATGAAAVGAARYVQTPAFGVDPPVLEYFSSAGGTPIYLDASGDPIVDLRQKPDIVAPDGGDNTFFGFDYESNGWSNFFGTSAAAPHAAGVAALMKSFAPGLTPAQIHAAMQASAIDMDVAGADFNTGSGLIQANQALASLLEPLLITTAALPVGRLMDYYLQGLAAEGGFAPYAWSIVDGNLPPGITLNASGTLSGHPTEDLNSPYVFTARVTDALGNSTTRVFSIDIRKRDCGSCHL